jgi:long-chain fatty acid transport protein
MKNKLLKITTISLLASSVLLASGWRIPEQSLNSVALSGAYVASANGADSSYFNPANMSFNDDAYQFETSLTYIYLSPVNYSDSSGNAFYNGKSRKEDFLAPTMFLTSKDYNGFRYGLSITAPGGLSKRWDSPYQKASAQEFSLKIIEFNPVVSYAVSSKFSIGGGLRAIYSDGTVRSDASGLGVGVQRDMEGDTIEFGYNLALTYKPVEEANIALTYRSNVDINEDGNAKLYLSGTKVYDGGANVTVPLPAVLAFSASYEFNHKTTVELEYDRTYWSTYKQLDFNYDSPIPAILVPSFDNPIPRNWKDTNAYRIGITHQYNDKLKLMAGFAIDESPAPSNTLGFELPDSDAKLYSVGLEYKINNKMKIGLAYLYDKKETRTVHERTSPTSTSPDGTFTNTSASLANISFKYRF